MSGLSRLNREMIDKESTDSKMNEEQCIVMCRNALLENVTDVDSVVAYKRKYEEYLKVTASRHYLERRENGAY